MRAPLIVVAAGVLSLAGCSTDVGPIGGGPIGAGPIGAGPPRSGGMRLAYTPPEGTPRPPGTVFVRDDPRDVLERAAFRLQQPPFSVEQVDERAGIVTARFTGDPEAYLNCGWITAHNPYGGAAQRMSAAQGRVTIPRTVDRREYMAERQLQLNGRVVVSVQPEPGAGTLAAADVFYVVTKAVDTWERGGDKTGTLREAMSFRSGGSSRFDKGTVCQPNGAVEQLVLAGLGGEPVAGAPSPASPDLMPPEPQPAPPETEAVAAVEPPAPVPARGGPVVAAAAPVEGFAFCGGTQVASAAPSRGILESGDGSSGVVDAAVEEALCDVVDLARAQPGRGLSILPLGARGDGRLVEGEDVVLTFDGLPDRTFLYVSYVQRDGTVVHLPPQWLEGVGRRLVYPIGYAVTPPFGREMIVALASPEPLFPGLRPNEEPAVEYAAALRAELDRAGPRIALSHAFLETMPR